jgi:hypothetical protein
MSIKANIKFLGKIFLNLDQIRFAAPWLRSLRKNYLLEEPSPWITFSAIDFVKNWLQQRKDIRIFEYGSGGSTLFWGKYASLVVSIEHDQKWYTLMKRYLNSNSVYDYRFRPPEKINGDITLQLERSDPNNYSTDDLELKNFTFQNYVTQIDCFPDCYFDIILIDGRSRPACIVHSLLKVKEGGLIIVDNADRTYYLHETKKYFSNFKEHVFVGATPCNTWFCQTNIFECIDGRNISTNSLNLDKE